jgi:hypothetical protein
LKNQNCSNQGCPKDNNKCNIGRNNAVATEDIPTAITNKLFEEKALLKHKSAQEQ